MHAFRSRHIRVGDSTFDGLGPPGRRVLFFLTTCRYHTVHGRDHGERCHGRRFVHCLLLSYPRLSDLEFTKELFLELRGTNDPIIAVLKATTFQVTGAISNCAFVLLKRKVGALPLPLLI